MPGVKTDHLAITLKGDTLILRGEVTPCTEEDNASYLRHERRAIAFTRSLTLPLAVDADCADAPALWSAYPDIAKEALR